MHHDRSHTVLPPGRAYYAHPSNFPSLKPIATTLIRALFSLILLIPVVSFDAPVSLTGRSAFNGRVSQPVTLLVGVLYLSFNFIINRG